MPDSNIHPDDIRPGYEQRDDARSDPRLDWWRDARAGLFIHWGLYAQPHDRWRDWPDCVTHHWTGEWVQHVKRIPRDRYVRWAETFDPRGFDADAWVALARQAGLRYMVITAKHHDGFCLFKTASTDFNVVDATPFGRDIIGELAEACRKQDLPFGVYYSQAQDWHHPDGLGNHWDDDPAGKDFERYLAERVQPHLNELLGNYGPMALVWFDTPMTMTPEQSGRLVDLVHELQPACLVSGRIGNGLGDYASFRDNRFAKGRAEFDFESPMTMNRTWGYVASDTGFKTGPELLHTLVDTASKGGNVLINVGPDGWGLVPDGNRRPLLYAGRWLGRNGRAIYGTRAGRFQEPGPIRCTEDDRTIYLHVVTFPSRGLLTLPAGHDWPGEVRVLATNDTLGVRAQDGRHIVQLPPELTSELPIVLAVPK